MTHAATADSGIAVEADMTEAAVPTAANCLFLGKSELYA